MLVEYRSLGTFTTCQRKHQWGESSKFYIHNSTMWTRNSLFAKMSLKLSKFVQDFV